eukprot:TRINITY_DN181_c0_g1_i3.p1 TRINITY_DN181_c0_g1~~TRINITY_DN181_c0_g1_i3.p1  ORF type:complete len:103 (-),score=43.94 TRINITY_DN181_c0_g1_i3:417-725(-)
MKGTSTVKKSAEKLKKGAGATKDYTSAKASEATHASKKHKRNSFKHKHAAEAMNPTNGITTRVTHVVRAAGCAVGVAVEQAKEDEAHAKAKKAKRDLKSLKH